MFTQTRIIGVVTTGSLQPSTIQIVGDWACPHFLAGHPWSHPEAIVVVASSCVRCRAT